VTRVFKLISVPWTRARFSDVVGLALRFDALTIPRPGTVNEMEWSEVDWDAERWTIPAAKTKTGWHHVVPSSRQALAILRSVQKLTGHSHALCLTAKGKALLERAGTLVQEHEKQLMKKVGAAGHKQLLQILAVFRKQQ
jgi:integrase